MSTITKEFTKEQLIEKLQHRISVASGFPESEKAQMDLELARIALASLEAEPVAYIFKHPAGRLFWALTDESNKGQSDVMPVYTAPPAPANAEPVAWLWSHRKHPSEVTLVRPEDDERAEGAHWSGWSCQALYAEPPAPVSVPDNSSITQHFDTIALEAAREIICDVNRHHEFLGGEVQLLSRIQCRIDDACCAAMLQGADGNSPVIPDGWVMVPVEPTMEMLDEFDSIIDYGAEDSKEAWSRLIAAAPQQEMK
ncbi:TPA: hypothetical protein ACG0A5_002971 [Enterobacter roggenkampii]